MTMMRGVFALALVLSLPAVLLCAPAETTSPSACSMQPPGGQWNAAAQWIAGLNDGPFTAAETPEQQAAWKDFSKSSAADWSSVRRQYLDRIEAWRTRNLPSGPASAAF